MYHFCFFFHAASPTDFYTLSLHDALPISLISRHRSPPGCIGSLMTVSMAQKDSSCVASASRSEEHTSELQSHSDLVCRLLLEKKKLESLKDDLVLLSRDSDTRVCDRKCYH